MVTGLGFGVVLALASMPVLRTLLFEIAPSDRLTLTAAVLLLLVASLGAILGPARRAARVDPLVALKAE